MYHVESHFNTEVPFLAGWDISWFLIRYNATISGLRPLKKTERQIAKVKIVCGRKKI